MLDVKRLCLGNLNEYEVIELEIELGYISLAFNEIKMKFQQQMIPIIVSAFNACTKIETFEKPWNKPIPRNFVDDPT